MPEEQNKSEIPKELHGKLAAFDSALTDVEKKFEPLLKSSQVELNAQLSSLDKAKLDLVAAYSINSLFWMYLNVCGVNPKDHGIKQELDRIRSYMNRVNEIQDKEKAPSLNIKASKRIVKSALWQAAQNQQKEQGSSHETCSVETGELSTKEPGHKKAKKRKSSELEIRNEDKAENKSIHKKTSRGGGRYMKLE